MSFAVRSHSSELECTLSLYTIDNRIDWCDTGCDTSTKTFSNHTAEHAHDFVTSYFSVNQEWDQKLLQCSFGYIAYDWFEYTKTDSPDLALGIKITGDRKVFIKSRPKEYAPIERSRKISITTKDITWDKNCELGYEQIKTERTKDPSVVALFNSHSFKKVKEGSLQNNGSRTLKVINKCLDV